MTSHLASIQDLEFTLGHTPTARSITDREAAILRRVLEASQVPGADVLLDQVRMLELAPESTAMMRIYQLHPEAPRSEFSREGRRKVPGRFTVEWLGGRTVGSLGVWVEDGQLRALQYVWLTERNPMTLPPPEWITVEAATPVPVPVAPAAAPAPVAAPTAAAAPSPAEATRP
ncbi:MAG: hypothetical protein JWM98_3230, partial [Thermoleophilia bacterium]|nr:hypothetical protein [Thermoleophilia bacterium]